MSTISGAAASSVQSQLASSTITSAPEETQAAQQAQQAAEIATTDTDQSTSNDQSARPTLDGTGQILDIYA